MDSSTEFRLRADDVVWREVDGEIIVLEMQSGVYLNLNGSAKVLWAALNEPVSVERLVALLVDTFGISEQQAGADSRAFLADLSDRSLVEKIA